MDTLNQDIVARLKRVEEMLLALRAQQAHMDFYNVSVTFLAPRCPR
jgi:hypothetical protein